MKMSKCDRVKPLGVLHVPLGGEAEREEILDFERGVIASEPEGNWRSPNWHGRRQLEKAGTVWLVVPH